MDETPKGWYIQYIDRDPETIRRQLELEKKKKKDLDDEEKTAKFIQEQVRRGLEGKSRWASSRDATDKALKKHSHLFVYAMNRIL